MTVAEAFAEIRALSVATFDEVIARFDARTDKTVAKIRAGCRALGADDERTERVVASFVREIAEPERRWFIRERNQAAAGITAHMAVRPPQV